LYYKHIHSPLNLLPNHERIYRIIRTFSAEHFPQHRNTATPQHRNTATPQHRNIRQFLLLILLLPCCLAFGQVNCTDPSVKQVSTTVSLLSTLVSSQILLDPTVSANQPQYIHITNTLSITHDLTVLGPNPYVFGPGTIFFIEGDATLSFFGRFNFNDVTFKSCDGAAYERVSFFGPSNDITKTDFYNIKSGVEISGSRFVLKDCIIVSEGGGLEANGGSQNLNGTGVDLSGNNIIGNFYGILVNDCPVLSIGSSSANANVINAGGVGIYVGTGFIQEAFVAIENFTITGFSTFSGTGIKTDIGNVNSSIQNGTISSFEQGMYLQARIASVRNVKIDEIVTGITMKMSDGGVAKISDNQVTDFAFYGIKTEQLGIGTSVEIRGNILTCQKEYDPIFNVRFGIDLRAKLTYSPYVINNVIQTNYPKGSFVGIRAFNVSELKPVLVNNSVLTTTNDPSLSFTGYLMDAVGSARLLENKAFGGPGSINENSVGFTTEECPRSHLCGNYSTRTTRGIEFLGESDNSYFSRNEMLQHEIGLFLDEKAVIGDQVKSRSTWPGPAATIFEAQHLGNPTLSRFHDNHAIIPNQNWLPDPVTPGNGQWFVDDVNLTYEKAILACFQGETIDPDPLDEQMRISNNEINAIQDGADLESVFASLDWDLELSGLAKLRKSPEQAQGNPTLSDFLVAHSSTSFGKLADLYADYQAFYSNTSLAGYPITSLMNNLQSPDALEQLNQIQIASTDRNNLIAQQIISSAEAIVPNNSREDALKGAILGNIQLYVDPANQDVKATLSTIAQTCRYELGRGVLIARATLGEGYNDECVGSRNDVQSLVSMSEIQGYPNPATNQVQFQLDNRESGWQAIVTNITGAQMDAGRTNSTLFVLSVTELPAGFYFIEFRSGSTVLKSRFSVQH
jgi:Secretion system C-terminal sorting domain